MMLLIPELSFKHALITWTHNFFFVSRSVDHLRPKPWGLIRTDHGKPVNRCTTSGVEWFDTASSAHYFDFASTAYCNSSRLPSFETVKNIQTADIDSFQLRWQTLLYCLSVRLWLRHWQCHMTKQAAHGQKTHTTATRLGNKYRLLISDQFYLSGRCRYVKKWLTSPDNDITADISCIPKTLS